MKTPLLPLAVSALAMTAFVRASEPLPDLFRFNDGAPVSTAEDWAKRRAEIAASVIGIEYGPLPPASVSVEFEDVGGNWPRRIPDAGPCHYMSGLVRVRGGAAPFEFRLDLLVPPGDGPFPVVLTGDGCYRFQEREMTDAVLRRGMVYAQFNRCEIARDRADANPAAGARAAFPGEYGALAFWAWGYHRAVDALLTLPFVDGSKIAATGHSRGGKAVLLAAATDPRIALVADSGSGCGGSGSFKCRDGECETIADITAKFPHWFAPTFSDWAGREAELPFDQHGLKALIAPRALLTLGGRGDSWANPVGTLAVHEAARAVWRLLGDEDAVSIAFRDGGHGYSPDDWNRFLDFAAWRFLVCVNGDLTRSSDSTLEVLLAEGAALEPLFGGPEASVKDGRVVLNVRALATGAFRVK